MPLLKREMIKKKREQSPVTYFPAEAGLVQVANRLRLAGQQLKSAKIGRHATPCEISISICFGCTVEMSKGM